MVVYIEYVVLNNLLANYCVMRLTQRFAGLKKGRVREGVFLFLSVVFGVVTPLLSVPDVLTVVIKLLCSMLLTKILARKIGLKRYLITLFVFYASSFGVAGAVSGILSFTSFGIEGHSDEELTFCVLVGCLIFLYIAGQIFSYLKSRVDKGECFVIFDTLQGDLTLSAFVDTGNCVKCRGTGVTFIPKAYKDRILHSDIVEYVSVRTINGVKVYGVCICDKMRFSDGRERIGVPVVFWESGKEGRVILSGGEDERVCKDN